MMRKKTRSKIIKIIFYFVVAILIVEGFSRSFFYQGHLPKNLYVAQPVVGYVHTPSSRIRYNDYSIIETNSLGLRGPELGEKEDMYRIAIVDASMTFNGAVPFEFTVTKLLEDRMNNGSKTKYEIINAGVAGYTLLQKKAMLEYLLNNNVQPDMVLMGYSQHDISGPEEEYAMIVRHKWLLTRQYENVPDYKLIPELFIFEHFNIARLLVAQLTKANSKTVIRPSELSEDDREDVDKALEIIKEMKQICDENDIRFYVLFNIEKSRYSRPNVRYEDKLKLFKDALNSSNIPLIDVEDAFLSRVDNPLDYFLPGTNIHYNAQGSKVFAEVLADKLQTLE